MKWTLNSWFLEELYDCHRIRAVCCIVPGPPFVLMGTAKWEKLYNETQVLAGIYKRAPQTWSILQDRGLKWIPRHSELDGVNLKCWPQPYIFICVWKICSSSWREEAAVASGMPLNNLCSSASNTPFYLMRVSLSLDYNHFQDSVFWCQILATTAPCQRLRSRLLEH